MGFFGRSESVQAVEKVVRSLAAVYAFVKGKGESNVREAIHSAMIGFNVVLKEQIKPQLQEKKRLLKQQRDFIEKLERYDITCETRREAEEVRRAFSRPYQAYGDLVKLKALEEEVQTAATNLKTKIEAEGLWS